VQSAEGGLALLRNLNFGRLWGSQILSQVAQNLLNFALIIRVFELAQHTNLANFSVALVVLSFGVPSIFFAAAAGVYVDHWNRKYVLVIANAVRAVVVLGYLLFEHNLAMVLLLSFIISTATQFFAPAEAASMPALVGEQHMLRANSLFIFTMYASFIVGYSASAPVIAALGAHGPYLVTAAMFLLATLLVLPLPSIRAQTAGKVSFGAILRRTGAEILRSWRLIRADHHLSGPIYQLAITQTCVGILVTLAPALSEELLKTSIQNAAHILILPVGFGMILGVALLGWMTRAYGKANVIKYGLLVGSLDLIVIGLSGYFYAVMSGHTVSLQGAPVVTLLVLVLGFSTAAVSAAAQTMLQEHTTDETRGKVFGALNMMVNIAATLPLLVTGILADALGATSVVILLGGLILPYAIIQFRRKNS
jgi:MFS family permease